MLEGGSTRSSRFSPNNRDSSIMTPELFSTGFLSPRDLSALLLAFLLLCPFFPSLGFPSVLSYSSQLLLPHPSGPNVCPWSAHLRGPVSPV